MKFKAFEIEFKEALEWGIKIAFRENKFSNSLNIGWFFFSFLS